MGNDQKTVELVYDHDCPFCRPYCEAIRLDNSRYQLKLVNAREKSPLLEEITQRGLNIDQGMYLKIGRKAYFGSDAIHQLTRLTKSNGVFL